MRELVLEVETLDEPLHVSSPLGTKARIDRICQGYELEIFGILLTVDLRVMDMSEFKVILEMDWLTAHQVVIDCDRMRVTPYTPDGSCVVFQGNRDDASPHTVCDSRWHGQLMGWLASLTLEDEVRQDMSLPRVVCEYEDVFLERDEEACRGCLTVSHVPAGQGCAPEANLATPAIGDSGVEVEAHHNGLCDSLSTDITEA